LIQKFDYYRQSEKPDFILCNPDGTELCSLSVSSTNCILRYNDTSELTFIAEEGITDGYELIETHRQIFVEDLGYFLIDSVSEDLSDDEHHGTKTVNAKSAQYELSFRILDYLSGVYPFYDSTGNFDVDGNPTTFMGFVLSLAPQWSVSYIDSALEMRYRSLEITKQTLLDSLYSTASKAYSCIFTFDFLHRTIRADAVSTLTETETNRTDIYLSFDNIIEGMDVSESADGIVTRLGVYGQDLDIRQVNPLGTSYIINLDYYKTSDWMNQELIDAINAWEEKVDRFKETYSSLLEELRVRRASLTQMQSDLTTLEGEKAELDNVISAQIEQGLTNEEIRKRYAENVAALSEKNAEITEKKKDISNRQAEVDSTTAQLSSINEQCAMDANFTAEQLLELEGFLIDGEYSNNNYIVTDLMTAEDIQDEAEQLYLEGLVVAKKLAQPSFTLSVDSIAFLHLPEFLAFTNQLELGCMVTVEKTEDVYYTPILLEMEFSWDDKDEFALSFGNRFHLNDAGYTYEELLGTAAGTSSSVSANWDSIVDFNKNYKDMVSSLLNNAFNVALHNIISSSNQDIVWDASGFTCRKLNENGYYENEQFKIINNMIAFTDDGWNTLKTVVGKILLEDGSYKYGVAAEVLVGKLLAGNNLVITNEGGTFRIDENGVSFLVGSDDGTEELIRLEDFIRNEMESIQSLVDGMVHTYWQEEMPYEEYHNVTTGSQQYNTCLNYVGDLWYNPETRETRRYTLTEVDGGVSFTWEAFADTEIPDELWDQIDGKRTIYTSCPVNGFAKDDLWIYEGVGIVQESTSADYRAPYDDDGTYFEKNDLLIATADSDSYNPALWRKYNTNIDKENGSFEFHLNDEGMQLKNGEIRMETGKNTVLLDPTVGIKILKDSSQQFWADTDGNLHLAGILNAAGGTFAGELQAAKGTFSGDLVAVGGTFSGNLSAAGGTFSGIVQAEDFLDADGNSMLNSANQFKGEYLELKGITVRNRDGEITFQVDNNGNVTVNGDVTLSGDTTFTWEDIEEEAAAAADSAVSDLANGNYSGGTFISGTKIYSPEIYSNDFTVYPKDETSSGGFTIYGYFDGYYRDMFSVSYYDSVGAPVTTMSTYGILNMDSYIHFNEGITFNAPDGEYIEVRGAVDFSNADVILPDGIVGGGVAKFG